MTVFYLFPCRSSWWTCFLPWPPSNGSNLSSKIVNISFFGKRGNLSNCFGQIRGEKNKKSKFRRTQFGDWAERIVLHLKLIFVAAPKVLYFCDRFRSENDRSDHLADKSDRAVPDKIYYQPHWIIKDSSTCESSFRPVLGILEGWNLVLDLRITQVNNSLKKTVATAPPPGRIWLNTFGHFQTL